MSKPKLPIRVRPVDVRDYKRLLVGDWTELAFDEALSLTRTVSGLPEGRFRNAEVPSHGRSLQAKPRPYPIPSDAPAHLREYLDSLNNVLLPSIPEELPAPAKAKQARLWEHVQEFAVLLTVEKWAQPTGDVGFLLDLRSLALQLALEFVLPKLDALGMTEERDYLLSAAWGHAVIAWQGNPSHQSFLQAGILAAAGHAEDAGNRYLHALLLCPRDSHEYLTLAHAHWFHLTEHGRHAEAETFLFSLHRDVRSEDAPEVEEMIRAHHRQWHAA